MRIIKSNVTVERFNPDKLLDTIEKAIRLCYKSEMSTTKEGRSKLIRSIISNHHTSTIEHSSITATFVIDRGISHELVRHRLCAFSQESTRYCNYSKGKFGSELSFIEPCFYYKDGEGYDDWCWTLRDIEKSYMKRIEQGDSPSEARCLLPNSLKTEIMVTANLREWRHIFTLRCSEKAHIQIRQVMIPLLNFLVDNGLGVIFDDIPMPPKPCIELAEVKFAE